MRVTCPSTVAISCLSCLRLLRCLEQGAEEHGEERPHTQSGQHLGGCVGTPAQAGPAHEGNRGENRPKLDSAHSQQDDLTPTDAPGVDADLPPLANEPCQ